MLDAGGFLTTRAELVEDSSASFAVEMARLQELYDELKGQGPAAKGSVPDFSELLVPGVGGDDGTGRSKRRNRRQ